MKNIKCVIFDADGMVIDSEVFSAQLEKDYGIPNDIILHFLKGPFQECIVGKADLKKEIKPFIKKAGWKNSVDELLGYWFKVQHKLDDRIIKEIKKLREKGVRCYLASNQEKYRAEYIRKNMGLENIFELIINGEEAIKIETAEMGTTKIYFIHNNFVYDITTGGRIEDLGILDNFKFID